MSSRRELYEFLSSLGMEPSETGGYDFQVFVSYTAAGRQKVEAKTTFRTTLSGYNDSVVSLTESTRLPLARYHLDFRPDFQQYVFDRERSALIISGSSAKMGGSYEVEVTPLDLAD